MRHCKYYFGPLKNGDIMSDPTVLYVDNKNKLCMDICQQWYHVGKHTGLFGDIKELYDEYPDGFVAIYSCNDGYYPVRRQSITFVKPLDINEFRLLKMQYLGENQ